MKHLFIVILTCMVAFILWAFSCQGQSVEVVRTQPVRNLFDFAHTYITEGKVALEWAFHGESRVWIEAKTADRQSWPDQGWHPGFTVLISQYKPIVTLREDGRYEVTFTQGKVDMP